MFGAEFPEEMSAFFSATDAQVLTDIKVDMHFHFDGHSPVPQPDTSRLEQVEKLLDLVQDEQYRPNRFMPQRRIKSMVIVLCLNFFMHLWKLSGHTQAQYEKVPKAAIARLIAYITGIDVHYVEDLIPSTNQAFRYVHLSSDKCKELERLLVDITDMPIQGTKEMLQD